MRALGNGQPAKKRLLYQAAAVETEIIQETAAEEPVKNGNTADSRKRATFNRLANICLLLMRALKKS